MRSSAFVHTVWSRCQTNFGMSTVRFNSAATASASSAMKQEQYTLKVFCDMADNCADAERCAHYRGLSGYKIAMPSAAFETAMACFQLSVVVAENLVKSMPMGGWVSQMFGWGARTLSGKRAEISANKR